MFQTCPAEISPWLHSITLIWGRGGWVGVDLFFVLSGFLVSGLLFREHQSFGTLRAGRFLIRRGFKIYPAFWALIFASIFIRKWQHNTPDLLQILSELLFVQNYTPTSIWGHTWSLAVEEHFYLLLACFFLFLTKRHDSRAAGKTNPFAGLPATFLVIAVGCLALRCVTLWFVPYGPDGPSLRKHLFPTHLRLDSLFFGVLLSYWYRYYPERFSALVTPRKWWFCLAGVMMLSSPFIWEQSYTPWMSVWGFTLYYLGSGLLLSGGMMFRLPDNMFFNGVCYIGSHSYSIYLWHIPMEMVAEFLYRRMPHNLGTWLLYATVYLLGSIFFGICMANAIEFPVLKLRNRWFPSENESGAGGKVVSAGLVAVGDGRS